MSGKSSGDFPDNVFDVANTKAVGNTTEAIVLAEFLKAGFPVLLPFGENSRYDMVVEVGQSLLRVQCKTAHRCGADGASLRFHTRSVRIKNRSGEIENRSYRGQADLFAAYAPCTNQVYILAVDDVPETDAWLRLTPNRGTNQYRSRMAGDCTLEAWAARLG